ncbi:FIST N domain protein [Marinobacterium sp. xm-d-579]|uniref:nitric oxide-sensing protein NosP n=1 Tax=Marinobacterium sp. xm-d-579 TaxID=2497734 RepID=UPI001567D7B8|nr:FIST N domain protein [Marinobacterium sp. xm-d-579]
MNAQSIFTASSSNSDPELAVKELKHQLNDPSIQFVLFFCSASFNLAKLGYALNEQFHDIGISGCTTAGEITPNGYERGSITAIGFSNQDFCVQVGSVKNLKRFTLGNAQTMLDQLRSQCTLSSAALNGFAITLVDGLSIDEEIFLATLNSALGSIPSFGGSAGDDVNLATTHVFFDGDFHTDAAAVLMVNTRFEFEVFTTHHLLPTDNKFVVTDAEPQNRKVNELNADLAATEYADALELSVDQLNNDICTLNPLAVKIGEQYFIRSIQSIEPDSSLTFFCAMENGIALTVMQPKDLKENLIDLFNGIESRIGKPQIVIGCDCFLRRREAELKGEDQQVSELLKAFNVIGLNTYGEQFSGMHINQTFTAVAIGQRRLNESV